MTTQQKLLVIAKKRLKQMESIFSIDPNNPDSRPSPKQLEILKDTKTLHMYLRSGNQCLAKGTLIATPRGPTPIESIRIGDTVYSEHGNEIKVLDTFYNGPKEVHGLYNRSTLLVEATEEHTFLTNNSSVKSPTESAERRVKNFERDTTLVRMEVNPPMGDIDVPYAYALGALIGGGCCRQSTKRRLYISSPAGKVPTKVARLLGATATPPVCNNYTWTISGENWPDLYYRWCDDKYSHEKYIDLHLVKSWNRNSIISLLAGVLDTKGYVLLDRWDNITIGCSMRAKSAIEFIQWAFLALWQTSASISISSNEYKRGDLYVIKIASNAYTLRILKELSPHMETERRQWKDEYSKLTSQRSRGDRLGVKIKSTRIVDTYDIQVDSSTNLYLLANGVVTHNSSKTALATRMLQWTFTETHPFWKRPGEHVCPICDSTDVAMVNIELKSMKCNACPHTWMSWGNESLIMIVVMQGNTHIHDFVNNRLIPLMEPGSYSTKTDSGTIKSIHHKATGNNIYFFSQEDPTGLRKRIQYFTAHYAWIDELPAIPAVFEELHRRVDSKRGRFLATFTPKVSNPAVKDFVDNIDPAIGKVYRLSKFDNPIFFGRETEELAKISQMPLIQQNSILYGDWIFSDNKRLSLNTRTTVGKLPDHYSPGWDHVQALDPAAAGKVGYTLFAKDPSDCFTWWVVKSAQLKGEAASIMLDRILPEMDGQCNIIKRIADPHEAWFIKEALIRKLEYISPYNKAQRRKELVSKLEEVLLSPTFRISEVGCKTLIDEINSAEEDPNKPGDIKHATRYHCIDATIYGLDCLPLYSAPPKPQTVEEARWQAWLHQEKNPIVSKTGAKPWNLRNQWRRR